MNLMSELAFSASIKGSASKCRDGMMKSLWHYSLPAVPMPRKLHVRGGSMSKAPTCVACCMGSVVPWSYRPWWPCPRNRAVFQQGVVHQLLDGYYIQVGLLVADDWGLPPPVVESIGFHGTTNMPKPLAGMYDHPPAGRLAKHFRP